MNYTVLESSNTTTILPSVNLVFRGWRTEANRFGVHREYLNRPLEISGSLSTNLYITTTIDSNSETLEEALLPFPSYSAFRLCRWYWSQTGTLSDSHFQQLTRDVYPDPMFQQEDVTNLDTSKLKHLEASYIPIPLSRKSG